jgi:Fic family protein
LNAVIETSKDTIAVIEKIKDLLIEYKHKIRNDYKFYSQDLLNNLFKHPYTKIEFLEQELGISRITAATYLNKLADDGLLRKEKLGTANYYVNHKLYDILSK